MLLQVAPEASTNMRVNSNNKPYQVLADLSKGLGLLLIICLLVNGWIFIKRANFENTRQAVYRELYPWPKNRVISYEIEGTKGVKVHLGKAFPREQKWLVKQNGLLKDTVTGAAPFISVSEGIHDYTLVSDDLQDSIALQIEYFSNESKAGMAGFGAIAIYNAPVPSQPDKFNFLTEGLATSGFNPKDLVEVRKIIKDSLNLSPADTTFKRVTKIATFLAPKICSSFGNPRHEMLVKSTMEQYHAATKGEKIWCGMYADILKLFLTAADIPNRMVTMSQSYGANGGSHILNEYYDREKDSWIAIDLTFSNLAYVGKSGNFLNAVEVKNLVRNDSTIAVLHYRDGAFKPTPINQMPEDYFYFYNADRDLMYYSYFDFKDYYSFAEKVKRYYSGNNNGILYTENYAADTHFFMIKRLMLQLLFLLFLLFFSVKGLNFLLKKLLK